MNVEIYSRKGIEELIREGFPPGKAVISFYSPCRTRDVRVSYDGVCDCVFYVGIPDLDREVLGRYGYTEESFLEEANLLAAFIFEAKKKGLGIICQCDFGQSRSAACAAAILEYFEGRGLELFADYRYYPNQLVYHKVMDALTAYGK